ncbi:MAG: sensor histidine kinase, partial [Novipirellula sp. JB048]
LAGNRQSFALLKADVQRDQEHLEFLEMIDSDIERISSITHQMYQLYRPGPRHRVCFTIEKAIADVVVLLEPILHQAKVTIDLQFSDSPTQVTLPEGEVKQILLNLIRNAIQASDAGQAVVIRVVSTRKRVRVVVLDHGHGISEQAMPSIFDPFYSTKSGPSKQGMGLGLSVSRSLIEAMGGAIEVESRLGEGSEFVAVFQRDSK